jgi:hypothetical protein
VFLGAPRELSPVEKHHESNLFWGPIAIGCSIVLTVIAAKKHDLRFLFFVAWPCLVFGAWHLSKRIPYKALSYWITGISCVVVAGGLWGLNLWLSPQGGETPPSGPTEPVTALAMQCFPQLLPIVIPPGGEAPLMFLHRNPDFNTQVNNTDHLMNWPLPKQAIVPSDEVKFGYKCMVDSLNQPVEDVSIPLRIVAGNNESTLSLQFPLLPQNQAMPLFIMNQCPIITSVFIPDEATLKLLGESTTRTVPLRGSGSTPVEKIMLFPPSKTKWANKPDCDWGHK